MKFWSDSFKDGNFIPSEFAFCMIDPLAHVMLSGNKNPHFAWTDLPAGTQSLALICCDIDVPAVGDDVNREDRTVPVDVPRNDFFHWVLVDLPADTTELAAGEWNTGIVARGKPGPATLRNARHGINDYTSWFAADPDMAGDYYGYDGPCPPWNDLIVHRYIFTLYALDIAKVAVEERFTGQQVRDAITGHILAEEKITGIYTLNPTLTKPCYGAVKSA